MNKKKIVSLCLIVCLLATAVVGGTLAYFTDTDNATNVFTAGDLEIVQNEKDRNGNDFVNDQEMWPIVNDGKDENGYHTGKNYVDKIVTVTNEGSEDAYVRTHIAFPAALDDGDPTFNAAINALHWNGASANDSYGAANWGGTIENDWYWTKGFTVDWPDADNPWNFYQTTVDGVVYNVYVATHASKIAEGVTTAPNLLGVYLDKSIDSETDAEGVTTYTMIQDGEEVALNFDLSNIQVLVVTEAAQAQGFEDLNNNGSAADDALNEAFGEVGTYCPFDGEVYVKPTA